MIRRYCDFCERELLPNIDEYEKSSFYGQHKSFDMCKVCSDALVAKMTSFLSNFTSKQKAKRKENEHGN